MTKKKTLKERVRERQEKTGERYTTALAQVTAQLKREPHDVTQLARALGFTCTASASEKLALAELPAILHTLKALLLALGSEPGAANMAAVLLHGEPGVPVSPNGISEAVEARGFMSKVAQGHRGVSDNGRIAVFKAADRTVAVTALWHGRRPAFLYLAPFEPKTRGSWNLFPLAGIGG